MGKSDRNQLIEALKEHDYTLLCYCEEQSKATEPTWNSDKGVFDVGHMLVEKNKKYGILFDLGNNNFEVYIPAKYDAVFSVYGGRISKFEGFFNEIMDYLGRFAIQVSDSLYIFDSFEGNTVNISFVATEFDEEFYYRDNKVFFIYNDSLYGQIKPFDEIKRVSCERNASAQDCYGNDNCYIAIKEGPLWSLYADGNKPKYYLKGFKCDGISKFGYYCEGRYIIINVGNKQRLALYHYHKNEFRVLDFFVDQIYQIGWCDLNNLYNPDSCEETTAFILKANGKYAILHYNGNDMSSFIFDDVLGFIDRDTIQVMQYNGQEKLYGEYSFKNGLNPPCIFTTPHKLIQR